MGSSDPIVDTEPSDEESLKAPDKEDGLKSRPTMGGFFSLRTYFFHLFLF